MTNVSVHDFNRETDCIYDGEKYSVRDNGAVFRHSRSGKPRRPNDGKWTFGKKDNINGYMHISGKRVHRIVATAFHNEPPTPKYVVDHIDTNRANNRPENLQWLTRLENALKNPITRKKIEFVCGTIEAFLKDPSILRIASLESNVEWMRTVTPQEAQACLGRMQLWARSDTPVTGTGTLDEWLFKPITPTRPSLKASDVVALAPICFPAREARSLLPSIDEKQDLVMAKTQGAAQRHWQTPTEFPCCPQNVEEPITTYASKLTEGVVFSRNKYSTHFVLKMMIIDDGQSICVMCESDGTKPLSLAKITFEDGLYVHASISTFFSGDGAEKQFCLSCGLEWTGGDTFDDYC